MYVALPHYQKGTHMSRFLEVLNDHQGRVGGAISPSDIPKITEAIRERLNAGANTDGTARASKEVEVPAYAAMREHPGAGEHMPRLLSRGVSTRDYKAAIRDVAGTLGVSKSVVSREFIERTEAAHDEVMARRFDDIDILAIYINGKLFGEHHAITAPGIDASGNKHVPGVVHGGSENAQAVKKLLTGLVERGIKPEVARLFIIDGSKAIRSAIDEVFGSQSKVQRCVVHKVRNVQDQLPKDKRPYAKMVITAAVKMAPDRGLAKLRTYAKELEVTHPDAAASLRDGLDDLFTVSRLGLPGMPAKSLRSTNPIESPHGLIARYSRRVENWSSPGNGPPLALRRLPGRRGPHEQGPRRQTPGPPPPRPPTEPHSATKDRVTLSVTPAAISEIQLRMGHLQGTRGDTIQSDYSACVARCKSERS